MLEMDEDRGSGEVRKEENGYTCQPEIRPTVFTAGWLSSLTNTCGDKMYTAVSHLSELVYW